VAQSEIPVRRVGVAQARREFSTLLNEVYRGDARVIVEKSGIPVAAIVPASELDVPASTGSVPDFSELDSLLNQLDQIIGSIPRNERQAVVKQALDDARKMRGDHMPAPGSPTEFFDRMMDREDIRDLMVRLADR
jgi:prevent-host-death family protein